ncbi:MAG: AMP-binding protein [Myxococcota bacterium]
MKHQLAGAYHFETSRKNEIWLTQPMGGGQVLELTWGEAMDQARRMAAYLKTLDLPAQSQIALFSKNSAWWIISDLAIWMAGHVSVPIYPTLNAETIRYIIEHSEAKAIFIGKLDGYEAMAPGIPDGLPRITTPLCPEGIEGATVWDDVMTDHEPLEGQTERDPGELATIVYTSGSTGKPKGVMHSFGTMTASGSGILRSIGGVDANDRMLSYLPLAHVYERVLVETTTLLLGFKVYFAESLETFLADLQRARPTIFASVPRLWSKFQMGVFKKMPPSKLNLYLKIPILNGIVRKKVLTGLGLDSVRNAASASAPIPAALIKWYNDLGLELLEGYGMSENMGYSHATRPGRSQPGYVGQPYDDVEHKLSEEGEILVKSPGTMLGYFKNEEATSATMTEDGFLKTGDRGLIESDGTLKITGRVKELFKTSKGKYVAPAPIENKLMNHPSVEQAYVGGNGQPQPYGVVMLSEDGRASLTNGGKADLEESLKAHLAEVNRGLDHHEHLKFIAVEANEWTIENGKLTPTMKLKRAKIEDAYSPKEEEWYGSGAKVVFG